MDRFTTPQARPLPPHLPAPVDDGAADHLVGCAVPPLELPSTVGGSIDLAARAADGLVLYAFPKMGPPDEPDPAGWADIPGAYGCTQQSCAFRDLIAEFAALGHAVVGVSAQSPESQREAHERLHLRFPLVADPERRLGAELGLPTFTVAGMTLYRRLTLVAAAGRVVKVFYPVFPPDEHPDEVLRWLRQHRGAGAQ